MSTDTENVPLTDILTYLLDLVAEDTESTDKRHPEPLRTQTHEWLTELLTLSDD